MNGSVGACLLTTMSFGCGLLAGHFLWTEDAPLQSAPASQPASAPAAVPARKARAPEIKAAHRVALAAPAAEAAPVAPEDYKRLQACFPPGAYHGSEFSLHVATSNSGAVTRVSTSGDEFLAETERHCVQTTVKSWRLGANVPEDLVLTVAL